MLDSKMINSVQNYNCAKCGLMFSDNIDYGYLDLVGKLVKCPNEQGCNSDKFKKVENGNI